MKDFLKTRISLLLVFVFAVTVLLGVFISLLLLRNQHMLQTSVAANQMVADISQRRLFALEYADTQSERAYSQWVSSRQSLDAFIEDKIVLFEEPGERERLFLLRSTLFEADRLFQELAALHKERLITEESDAMGEKIELVSSQLVVKIEEALGDASTLYTMSAEEALSTVHNMRNLFAGIGGIFLALLFSCFVTIWLSARTLSREKSKTQAVINGIGDGVVAIDRSWNIVLWNTAAAAISGWSAREAVGKPFKDVVSFIRENDRSPSIQFIEDVLITGEVRHMEDGVFLIKKDGTEIPVGDSAAPIFDSAGTVAGCVVIFRDITKELENRSLKSDFAYASHQMLTPVNKALWCLEGISKNTDLSKIHASVQESNAAIKSVQKLVSELLEVSLLDQKNVVVNRKEMSLVELVRHLVEELRPKAEDRKVVLALVAPEDSLVLNTDPSLMRRMLFEVLDNAVLYSLPGSEVRVSLRLEDGEVLIEVQGESVGIPEDQLSLTFTKFFRGNNIDTTLIPGAGLGLYIARAYAELLHGKMWFASRKEQVSFFVRVPSLDAR